MRFSVDRAELMAALEQLAPVDNLSDPGPFAGEVLIGGGSDCVYFRGKDMAFVVQVRCEAEVEGERVAAVCYRDLSDLATTLAEGTVRGKLGNQLVLRAGKDVASLPVRDASGFPTIPPLLRTAANLRASSGVILEALKGVAYAMSRDVTNHYASARLRAGADGLRSWATDRERVAVREIQVDRGLPKFELVLGGRVVKKLLAVLPRDETVVEIAADANALAVRTGGTELVGSRIQDPGISDLIWDAKEVRSRVTLSLEELRHGVDLTSLAPSALRGTAAIHLEVGSDRLVLSSEGSPIPTKSTIGLETRGAESEAVVGASHLSEAVRSLTGPSVALSVVGNPALLVLECAGSAGLSRAVLSRRR